jgi:acyl-CoA reductase-like NAD-dependent aldehyde dehydrogenase
VCNQTSPDFDAHAFEAAVDLTAKAFESWKRSTPDVKAAGLLKWKRLCEENADDLALLITAEVSHYKRGTLSTSGVSIDR